LQKDVEQPVTFSPTRPEPPAAPEPPEPPSPGSLAARVADTIEAIRPAVQADGGDLLLKGVDEATGAVDIELVGACVGCPASTYTLKAGIERILKDRVEGVTEVNALGLDDAAGFDY
jgi:Fe-S cluster biogenesis protein NfuA